MARQLTTDPDSLEHDVGHAGQQVPALTCAFEETCVAKRGYTTCTETGFSKSIRGDEAIPLSSEFVKDAHGRRVADEQPLASIEATTVDSCSPNVSPQEGDTVTNEGVLRLQPLHQPAGEGQFLHS